MSRSRSRSLLSNTRARTHIQHCITITTELLDKHDDDDTRAMPMPSWSPCVCLTHIPHHHSITFSLHLFTPLLYRSPSETHAQHAWQGILVCCRSRGVRKAATRATIRETVTWMIVK